MSPGEARARFASARVARMATVGPGGRPHVVPITFALDGDTIVTAIDAKPKRSGAPRRLGNIGANPRVAVLVDAYDENWSRLWWARADGEAMIHNGGPARERALELLRGRYPQYASVGIDGPAIIIRVERWSGWTAEVEG